LTSVPAGIAYTSELISLFSSAVACRDGALPIEAIEDIGAELVVKASYT